MLRPRNVLLLLPILFIGWFGEFAYRKNYLCGPGDHILKSEADALEAAKSRVLQARYLREWGEKPTSVYFGDASQCCRVTRTRTIFGVIVWKAYLEGETAARPAEGRHVSAQLELSNCGTVFDEDSFMTAEIATPAR